MSTAVQQVEAARNIVLALGDDFARVCCDKAINFDREAGFAMQILQSNSYTLGIALQNPESLRAAVTNVAAIGISLNPAQKQAYLVPRKGPGGVPAVCLDISYMGLLHLAQIAGAIFWGKAFVVRANDVFTLNGLDKPPTHSFSPFAKTDVRGDIVGAYVVVKTCDGDYLTHTMTVDDINAIRARSESFKSGKNSPWLTDYEEMAKKTVVKQAHKYWPHRERLQKAVHYLDTDGGEGVERVVNPPSANVMPIDALEGWINSAIASTTEEGLAKVWANGVKAINEFKDKSAYDGFKLAVIARGAELKAANQDATEGQPE